MRRITSFAVIKRYLSNATKSGLKETNEERSFARMSGKIFHYFPIVVYFVYKIIIF
jgi:hypothetical protein